MNKKMQLRSQSQELHSEHRNSNLELFRIITMLCIVAHHYVVNSGLMASEGPILSNPTAWRSIFLLVFGAFGKTGINCFVLITGYFMCKSQITVRKFAKLLLEIEFYKIIIGAIFLISGYESLSVSYLVRMFLPITNVSTGFTSCYLLFYWFIPFLNCLIQNITKSQFSKLLLLLSVIYIGIGSIPGFGVTMNYVSWFIVVYLFGAYIRMYDNKILSNVRLWGISTAIVFVVSVLSVIAITWGRVYFGISVNSHYFVSDSNKVLAVALAITSFLFFKNIQIRYNRFVNTVAASTFGVLMIHANSDTMRRWLWQDVFHNVTVYSLTWMPVLAISSVVCVYIICTMLDYIRITFIEKRVLNLWDALWNRVMIATKGKN